MTDLSFSWDVLEILDLSREAEIQIVALNLQSQELVKEELTDVFAYILETALGTTPIRQVKGHEIMRSFLVSRGFRIAVYWNGVQIRMMKNDFGTVIAYDIRILPPRMS